MEPNPPLGVLLHATGGLAAASFYLPFKKVKNWSWETYWITGGIFSWLIAPPLFGLLVVTAVYRVPLFEVILASPAGALLGAFGFGVLWGVGGLTFGLSMRYLGIGLGYAVALGFCAAFGQLVPPIAAGGYFSALMHDHSKLIILLGVIVALGGIAFSGAAGMRKERELTADEKRKTAAEFSLMKGLVIATICGLLSACMAFAIDAGGAITRKAVEMGTPELWSGLPLLVVIMLGGLLTNGVWCVMLFAKNGTFGEFAGRGKSAAEPAPKLAVNYGFSAMAGVTWYFQFFFYTMGGAMLGASSKYSSWTLHMACIIIFSTIWGALLKEWKGTSKKTHGLIAAGLALLIGSTIVIGIGNYQATKESAAAVKSVH